MRKLKIGITSGLLILVAAYVLFPIYWIIVASTKTESVLFHSPTLQPSSLHSFLDNIRTVFTANGGAYGRWMINSAIYGLVAAAGATYLAGLTGFALAKYRFRGRSLMTRVIIGSLMIPSTVLIVPLFIMEAHVHLTNTYEGVILPLFVFPFGVYFMSIYAEGAVPLPVLDAGRVDGARETYLFHRVALPMMLPGMVTMFLISFVGAWNNYFLPLVLLSKQSYFPLTVGLSNWLSSFSTSSASHSSPLYPQVITAALVSVVPMLLMFPLLQRYLARGLTFGALAGE